MPDETAVLEAPGTFVSADPAPSDAQVDSAGLGAEDSAGVTLEAAEPDPIDSLLADEEARKRARKHPALAAEVDAEVKARSEQAVRDREAAWQSEAQRQSELAAIENVRRNADSRTGGAIKAEAANLVKWALDNGEAPNVEAFAARATQHAKAAAFWELSTNVAQFIPPNAPIPPHIQSNWNTAIAKGDATAAFSAALEAVKFTHSGTTYDAGYRKGQEDAKAQAGGDAAAETARKSAQERQAAGQPTAITGGPASANHRRVLDTAHPLSAEYAAAYLAEHGTPAPRP